MSSKANYKSYDAQQRLVRAIVAAHPEIKWNYKGTVSLIIREGRKAGFDMKNLVLEDKLPIKQDAVDRNNIAKYFGSSTPDGIQFQFRTIKKDAEKLRNGQDITLDSTMRTPSKPTAGRGTGTGSRTSTAKRVRRTTPLIKQTSSGEDDDADSLADIDNWSEQEDIQNTPSKRPRFGTGAPGQKNGTPSRKAAARASATIADASAKLMGYDDSGAEMGTSGALPPATAATGPPPQQQNKQSPIRPAAAPANTYTQSIFGPVDTKLPPPPGHGMDGSDEFTPSPFAANAVDAFVGSGVNGSHYSQAMDELDEGEI